MKNKKDKKKYDKDCCRNHSEKRKKGKKNMEKSLKKSF